jgi:hypothetical protein
MMVFATFGLFAQNSVQNFKVKNKTNQVERTEMLDLLRVKVKAEINNEVQFVVNHFKVSGDYAWFKGDAKRFDGKAIEFSEDAGYDCCHVEGLFKKQDGKWTILEANAFSTDVWWDGIEKKYPKANRIIFKD